MHTWLEERQAERALCAASPRRVGADSSGRAESAERLLDGTLLAENLQAGSGIHFLSRISPIVRKDFDNLTKK